VVPWFIISYDSSGKRPGSDRLGPLRPFTLMRASSLSLLAAFAASLGLLSVACSGAEEAERPAGLEDAGSMGGSNTPQEVGCEGDAERSCTVTFNQANGAKSCFTGVQFCDDGAWSACFEPEYDPRLSN
jgi:hypothetical protein